MRRWRLRILVPALALACLGVTSPSVAADKQVPISRDQYKALKKRLERQSRKLKKLRKDYQALKEKSGASSGKQMSPAVRKYLSKVRSQIQDLQASTEELAPGSHNLLLSGYATGQFTDPARRPGSFGASFNPVVLWKLNDRLFFESEIKFDLSGGGHGHGGGGGTEVELEYANMTYTLNDYVTFSAGKFLTPFSIFPERLHPSWINKMPDAPLPFQHHDGLVPISSVGAQVRGGVPLFGKARGNYAFYLSNGPTITGEVHHHDEAGELGRLSFANYDDPNNNKAVGGRVGFLPFPALEVGGSFQFSRPGDEHQVDALLLGADLTYKDEIKALNGTIELRSEWIWSSVDDRSYHIHHEGAPHEHELTFDNHRSGGYVQLAYRPNLLENEFLSSLEPVARYDVLNRPDAVSFDRSRYSFGVNYWLSPSTVVKGAYEIDDRDGGGREQDRLLLEMALGF